MNVTRDSQNMGVIAGLGRDRSKAPSVLFINPLRERHGSTYRARNLFRLLRNKTRISYVEPDNHRESTSSLNHEDSRLELFRAVFEYLHSCFKVKFDLLYLQKPMILTWPCLALAKLMGRRVVIDFDDLDSKWQTSWFRGRLAGLSESLMPRWADAITTHNEYLREHISRTCGKRIFVVPQGVDTDLFAPHRFKRAEEKKRLGLQDKTVFCFLGSFTKGSAADLDIIIKAYRSVLDKHRNTILMLVGGGGPLEEHYLSMISALGLDDNVMITGRKDQKIVPQYLSCADYGLVFMRDNVENRCRVSLKLLEYLSMELPVIGHVVGHSRDVFGSYCFLCKPDEDSLRAKMLDVMNGQSRKKSARGFIVQNYDWERIGPALDSVLQYCMGKHSR